jgi:GNAT superfamily N-acetyltransferase
MSLSYRRLDVDELARVGEIDRTEAIDMLYVQEGGSLREVRGDFSAPPWAPVGTGEHSVAAQRAELARYVEKGAVCIGAFDDRLIGIGVVLAHLRPGVAQLAYLYVTDGRRGEGVGSTLTDELECLAREAGSRSMVVSATPSRNTVDFYRRRGYAPMAEPLSELYELEPEDIHLDKTL